MELFIIKPNFIRYLFWGIGIFAILWDFVGFVQDLIEVSDPKTDYPTTFDAINILVSGLIYSSVYFFYAELYHLLTKIYKK
jgi:hypothetical protein